MTRVMLESGIGPLGELVFASSMVGVDPRDRPRVRCPECDDLLTFKAGERGIVTPHVAHRSGSACAATNPETAAHFNAKMLLTRVLTTRGTLRLRTKCYRFGHHVEDDWHVPAWQRAEAEFRVETRRPDVAVFGEGDAVVGAVEVLHTHRVDRRKASDYAASGLPWVEFRAEHVLAWDGNGALPVEAADAETLRELNRSCARCPKPAPAEAPEVIAARRALILEANALRAEIAARPLPSLNIVAASAGGLGFVVTAARVVAPKADVRIGEVRRDGWISREPEGILFALRLLAASPKVRPAVIWCASEMAVDYANLPPRLCHGSVGTTPETMEEIARLMAQTGSIAKHAPPGTPFGVYVEGARYHAEREHMSRERWHRRETSAAVARKGGA